MSANTVQFKTNFSLPMFVDGTQPTDNKLHIVSTGNKIIVKNPNNHHVEIRQVDTTGSPIPLGGYILPNEQKSYDVKAIPAGAKKLSYRLNGKEYAMDF